MSANQPTTHQPTPAPRDLAEIAKYLPDAQKASTEALDAKGGDGYSEKVVDAIEMIGEEVAGEYRPKGSPDVTPGMRYLHCSRTIHQLVTDRNKAVGIFLAVASLLLTASSVILNASPKGDLIIPMAAIQKWCLPIAFGVLTVLSVFVAFLLIRTRVGLIYEVAKMNALLGLPVGRVQRINPMGIFFIMQALISLAGGFCAGMFTVFMVQWADRTTQTAPWWGALVGVILTVGLMVLYILTIHTTTSDQRLQNVGK